MRKNRLLITVTYLFCFTLLFLFCGCASHGNAAEKETTASPEGNSDANLNNLGLAATDGETLYDISSDGGYDIIYKAATNGAAAKAIVGLDGYIQFLNISGDYFYFVGITYDGDSTSSEAIFRADLKGEEREWLFDIDKASSVSYMRVVDDTVFYAATTAEDAAALYAVNLDSGKKITLLSAEKAIESVDLTADSIYYAEGNQICRANLDGSAKEALYTGEIWLGNLILDGDTLYFVETQKDKTDSIRALSIAGGEPKTLLSGINWINYLNIDGKTLYYADHTYDGEGNLKTAAFYGLSLDSEETTLVGETDASYVGFSIVDNKLIYQEENDGDLSAKVLPLAE
ncbi:MAG TPA: DUF5050 domain-containing protein [Clostridiales bacterium]|nr:DUF5050 domain-containing protein [Clostridiales bacterium]